MKINFEQNELVDMVFILGGCLSGVWYVLNKAEILVMSNVVKNLKYLIKLLMWLNL